MKSEQKENIKLISGILLSSIALIIGFAVFLFGVTWMRVTADKPVETETETEIPPVETETEFAIELEPIDTEQLTAETTEVIKAETEDKPLFPLSDEEFLVACRIVQGEAANQGYIGKCLVAQCLLQACLDDDIQPSVAREWYKYSGWSEDVTEETERAVKDTFYKGFRRCEMDIKYFYAPGLCDSSWHETQVFALEYGGHRFFEEKES